MTSVLRRQGDYSATERPTVGDLKMSLVGVDHIGWLKCDGRQVPIAAFRQLFDVISYQFGNDVSSGYFRLPNPEGRVLGIAGQDPGITRNWAIGDVSGEEYHTLTLPEIPIHNHDFAGGAQTGFGYTDTSGQHIHDIYTNQDDYIGSSGGSPPSFTTDGVSTPVLSVKTAAAGAHRHRIAANGGDQPHNNIQPTIWIGNLFVYGGRLFRDAPSGGNWFPPNSFSPSGGVVNVF